MMILSSLEYQSPSSGVFSALGDGKSPSSAEGFAPLSLGSLVFAPLSEVHSDRFINEVTIEISKRYPETGEQYAREVLASPSGKMILACYSAVELLGFTVATPKYGRKVKFGPTIVLPSARGLRIARLLRRLGEEHFHRRGYSYFYSTCNETNYPAQAYVVKAGYRLVARLHSHYTPGSTELVYAKYIPSYPIPTALPNFGPHGSFQSSFTIRRKRGGSAKIEMTSPILRSERLFLQTMEEAVDSARASGFRRVYLKLAADFSEQAKAAARFSLYRESLPVVQPELVLARNLE